MELYRRLSDITEPTLTRTDEGITIRKTCVGLSDFISVAYEYSSTENYPGIMLNLPMTLKDLAGYAGHGQFYILKVLV